MLNLNTFLKYACLVAVCVFWSNLLSAQSTGLLATDQNSADSTFTPELSSQWFLWNEQDMVDSYGPINSSTTYNMIGNSTFGFQNISGGPPKEVGFGQAFPVNITLQAFACGNSNPYIRAVTSTVNNQSHAVGQYTTMSQAIETAMANSGDDEFFYFTDYQDVFLGNFTAPKQTDVKQGTTTYQNSPTFQVNTHLQTNFNNSYEVASIDGAGR